MKSSSEDDGEEGFLTDYSDDGLDYDWKFQENFQIPDYLKHKNERYMLPLTEVATVMDPTFPKKEQKPKNNRFFLFFRSLFCLGLFWDDFRQNISNFHIY